MSDHVIDRDIAAPTRRARRSKQLGKRSLLVAAGLAILAGAADYGHHWWTIGRFVESTDDSYVGGDVTPIAPHVAGFVQQVLVKDNQHVRAGQSLVRLDPDDYQATLNHANAVLQARVAALANLRAKRLLQQSVIAGAEADLAAQQARAEFADQDAKRYQLLALTAAGSRQSAQKALADNRSARAGVRASQAAAEAAGQQLSVLDTEITAAEAGIAQATADLRTAQLNLGYTDITAPIDGYIGNRYAQVGAYVASGTNLLSVVPARGLWVDANFKEDQLAQMKPGDPATIVADVLPGRPFHGHVASLAPATGAVFSVIPPQNATGNFTKIVQRVPVRITLDGNATDLGLLRPGLSVTASVDTKPPRVKGR
ncbi:MAG TPA: HlyD family secretion protein [Roseiflexaceae bacterium]|jgi:membrane fusion protein (multidrug efflux system)|nr:HlyD family secretion protein [Roseiflexaceae bacterium]